MPKVDTNRFGFVKRLIDEGWENAGRGDHDNVVKSGQRKIQVPRHKTRSPGVARSIAKAAGWI